MGSLLLQSGGEGRVSAIPRPGVDVKKNKPTHNSSLNSPTEVSDSCCVPGALVKEVTDGGWQTVLSLGMLIVGSTQLLCRCLPCFSLVAVSCQMADVPLGNLTCSFGSNVCSSASCLRLHQKENKVKRDSQLLRVVVSFPGKASPL